MTSIAFTTRSYVNFRYRGPNGMLKVDERKWNNDTGRAICWLSRWIAATTQGGNVEIVNVPPTSGANLQIMDNNLVPTALAIRGICTDGAYFYLNGGNTFLQVDVFGNVVATTGFGAGGGNFGFEMDGRFLYCCHKNNDEVRVHAPDGSHIKTYSVRDQPVDLTTDGRNWFVYRDEQSLLNNLRFITMYDKDFNVLREWSAEPSGTGGGASAITHDGERLVISFLRREPA